MLPYGPGGDCEDMLPRAAIWTRQRLLLESETSRRAAAAAHPHAAGREGGEIMMARRGAYPLTCGQAGVPTYLWPGEVRTHLLVARQVYPLTCGQAGVPTYLRLLASGILQCCHIRPWP